MYIHVHFVSLLLFDLIFIFIFLFHKVSAWIRTNNHVINLYRLEKEAERKYSMALILLFPFFSCISQCPPVSHSQKLFLVSYFNHCSTRLAPLYIIYKKKIVMFKTAQLISNFFCTFV